MEKTPPQTKGDIVGTTALSENDAPEYLESWKLGIVIACLFFGDFLIAIDTNIINVAIPKISSEFHSLQDVAWYGTAYLITLTAFQPIYGTMYKSFNTDAIYRASILIFEGAAKKNSPRPQLLANYFKLELSSVRRQLRLVCSYLEERLLEWVLLAFFRVLSVLSDKWLRSRSGHCIWELLSVFLFSPFVLVRLLVESLHKRLLGDGASGCMCSS